MPRHRCGMDAAQLRDFMRELSDRGEESLKLFRPQEHQEEIFTSTASELLIRGGNRSGKSVCVAVLLASEMMRTPVRDHIGVLLPLHAPPEGNKMTVWLVGYGEKHIGQTFHRLLFQPGLFEIIKDEQTQAWRAYQPWRDWDRRKERKPAPPLIPRRMIDKGGWGWKNKSIRHFEVCRLVNGTEIFAFTSIGDPKMGDPVDRVWVDEAIRFPKHYAEWQARISDRKGRIFWSAWPGRVNSALINLHSRAKAQVTRIPPDVQEVRLAFSQNQFVDDDEKRKRLEGWSPDEALSRDLGEFVRGNSQVYPTFSAALHSTPCQAESQDDEVDAVLRKTNGVPPDDWSRTLILDPGHTHPGVLFAAIPPPRLVKNGDKIVCGVVYDEIYLPSSDATEIAKACLPKMEGYAFHTFLIDFHAGRQTPMGFSMTIADQYSNAFREQGLFSLQSGSAFSWSSDDVEGGLELVRVRLRPARKFRPWLRVVSKTCPNFMQQMELYEKQTDARGFVLNKPAPRQVDCLCDCVRYWVQNDPTYITPDQPIRVKSPAWLAFTNDWSEKPKGQVSITLGMKER